MNTLKHVKISTRLLVTFFIVIGLLVGLAGFTAYKLKEVLQNVDDMRTETEVLHMAEQWQANIKQNSTRLIAIAYASNGNEISEVFKDEIAKITADTTVLQKKYEQIAKDRNNLDDQKRLANLAIARTEYLTVREKVKQLKLSGDTEASLKLLKEGMIPAVAHYIDTAQANIDEQLRAARQENKDIHDGIHSLLTLGSILLVICIIIVGFAGWVLYAGIMHGIRKAQTIADRVGSGDLRHPITIEGNDEFAQLERSMGKMQDNLYTVVHKVQIASESVSTASAEIAQGNHDLSARTEQQASALEETSASMMELSSKVKENSHNADMADKLARTASTIAAKGSEEVGNVIATMNDINTSSNKIADIISVIDGIAFQTNILALNAAVEAARAGEEGRGFAVVASEVRSLAGRSAAAAKEIKQLINASVERVEQGTELVTKAGSTMTELARSIEQVTAIMGEISASSSEQANGVAQVGEAIQQMDGVTQQNAALVEEMAAAAQSLEHQADAMVQTVSIFKV